MCKLKHGTCGAYNNHHCRCKKCTAAHAAHTWAVHQVEKWEDPICVVHKSVPTIGTLMIPAAVVERAVVANERKIKLHALVQIWHNETERLGANFGNMKPEGTENDGI